jgi:XTP/dITP diphosphohydrolase
VGRNKGTCAPAEEGIRSVLKILIASRNKGKIEEIKSILANMEVEFATLLDYPSLLPPQEGKDYRKNALDKALFGWQKTGLPTLAEDSGLEVDALGKEPGVESARFLQGYSQKEKNQRIIDALGTLPLKERSARFVCYAVFVAEGIVKEAEGVCNGYIGFEQKGDEGFGYDPIFVPEGFKKTFAELGSELKNRISHRAKAMKKLEPFIMESIKRMGGAS